MSEKINHVSDENIAIDTYRNSIGQISYNLKISYRDKKGKWKLSSVLITSDNLPKVMSLLQKSAILPSKAIYGFYSSKGMLNESKVVVS